MLHKELSMLPASCGTFITETRSILIAVISFGFVSSVLTIWISKIAIESERVAKSRILRSSELVNIVMGPAFSFFRVLLINLCLWFEAYQQGSRRYFIGALLALQANTVLQCAFFFELLIVSVVNTEIMRGIRIPVTIISAAGLICSFTV
eukprot:GHVH01007142.1.p1 GENE.GHVH01007142.1~~GHVH01007142.1.p1  ORF type:complete len:150 (+),score=2.30 GHVH01007142.1:81-530(+)